jgi:CubicO group peptidase (beta-lactamase class C family)
MPVDSADAQDGCACDATFWALGRGSQFVVVVPALDLVVVTTGGNDYNGKHTAVLPLVAELVRSLNRTGAG